MLTYLLRSTSFYCTLGVPTKVMCISWHGTQESIIFPKTVPCTSFRQCKCGGQIQITQPRTSRKRRKKKEKKKRRRKGGGGFQNWFKGEENPASPEEIQLNSVCPTLPRFFPPCISDDNPVGLSWDQIVNLEDSHQIPPPPHPHSPQLLCWPLEQQKNEHDNSH